MPTVSEPDIRHLDARAVQASVAVVSRVTAGDLGRATPCGDWTLGELLAHMTAQHRGFAAASAGRGADPDVWRPDPVDGDPVPAYTEAAERVVTAFAREGVLEQPFAIPEITTRMTFPGARAIGFHAIDYVVHTWDVARCLGLPPDLPPDLVAAALPLAEAVPDGPERLAPGAAFRPGLAVPDGADPLDRILRLLGRSPDWPA
jgi:uncharacterized protein (TIGR03086 family)